MRPKLKLNNLRDLHEARYCAAVGIDLLSFRMEDMTEMQVAGIMEWLSGPESVGVFAYESSGDINAACKNAGLAYVSVPMDYPQDQAGEISLPLIFTAGETVLNPDGLASVRAMASAFPEAHFEFCIDEQDAPAWEVLMNEDLVHRCLLCFDDPDSVYAMLQKEGHKPFAFTLGSIFEEPDGALDYEKCDDFIAQFEELLPA